jgi:anaerobic ribonucleoside-triphosphate reductase activating protein
LSNPPFMEENHVINIAQIVPRTKALGPGTRAALWVQGCPFHCPGCIAPDWIPFIPAIKLSPEEILEKIDLDAIDGITLSGGEPMEQAAGLAALIQLARRRKDLDLICFTGYRYERLVSNPPNRGVPELLQEVDVLIDGPFIQSLNDSVGLRGSSNQRVIHLTSRLREHDLESQSRRVEVTIRRGELALVGIPTPGILSSLEEASLTRLGGNS